MLVNGTRERSPVVRTKSEIALISLIHLNKPDSVLTVIKIDYKIFISDILFCLSFEIKVHLFQKCHAFSFDYNKTFFVFQK